ncbi:hypothetical protein N2W54_008193 [Lotmaria passim]
MTVPKTFLGAVHHIGEHSIFFLPSRSHSLDFKTLSTAPPCHRAVLRRHGLVAKVYASIACTDEAGKEMFMINGDGLDSGNGITTSAQREALSLSGRQELWRSALTYAGLLSDKGAVLATPYAFQSTQWPFLSTTQYRDYVRQAVERSTCAAVNSSTFCVPLLSLQEYVYKRGDLQLCLAVIWMPYYPQNLRQWVATFEAAGKPVPEASLLTMLHHMTIAQLTVRSGDTIAGRSEAVAGMTPLSVDSILVYHNDEGKEDWNDEPIFLLTVSVNEERCAPSTESGAGSPTRPADSTQQQLALYRPPEECTPRLYPASVPDTAKRTVWALGVVLYLVASGRVSIQTPPAGATASGTNANCKAPPVTRGPCRARTFEEVPLNAAAMTPDALWKRLRRDLECRGYHGTLTTVAAQLLSLDPLTRPSLTTVDRMLQDLHRPTPILRFPFAIGGYDLLRLPNPATSVELNPGARRYTFAETCVLCKKPRSSTAVCAKGGDHQAAGVTSPSWNDEGGLLPDIGAVSDTTYVTYLYPLCDAANGRQRRKQVAHALQCANASMSVTMSGNASCCNPTQDVVPLDCNLLLQVFGGFAVYERRLEQNSRGQVMYRAKVCEVLIPYPCSGLRRNEQSLVKTSLVFGGGLPWPSWCTETLRKSGRVSRRVPFTLTGAYHDVEWFAWVLPGERFALPNGAHWTAPLDGAFVFWFGPDLQPTDRDRYFAIASARSATLPAKVHCTQLPDSLFRQHISDENQVSTLLMRSIPSSANSRSGSQAEQSGTRSPAASAARRRSIQSVTDIVLPAATHEIVEAEGNVDNHEDAVLHSDFSHHASRPASADNNAASAAGAGVVTPRSTRRRRSSATHPRRSLSYQASVVMVVAAHASTAMDDAGMLQDKRRSGRSESAAAVPASSVTTATTINTPHAATTNCSNDTNQLLFSPAPASASGATSPQCSTPGAYHRFSSRESTQPPTHRDASFANARALALMPVNETLACRSPRGSAREAKKRKSRVMTAEKVPRAAPQENIASTTHRNLSPLLKESERPSCNSGAAAAGVGLAASESAQNSRRKLSPRSSKRPTSPQTPTTSSTCQTPSGVATPTWATPKLTPLSHAVSALGTLRICGLWLPASVIDAAFQALTFWVFCTGEHGDMQPPIKMPPRMGYALRTPPGAVYVAFLSNQLPLFRRNHPYLDMAVFSPMLPHHGFACYDAEGTLLGVLALRCSVKDDADALRGEFVVDTHVRDACHGSQVSSRAVYASYLAGSVGDEKTMLQERPGSEAKQVHHLRHAPSLSQGGMDSRTLWNTPSEAQTLTFTSARHLVGEFTPHEKEDFAPYKEPTVILPACWVGFDSASGSLLFSDVSQGAWVPYSIGD